VFQSSAGLEIVTQLAQSARLDTLIGVGGGELPRNPACAANLATIVRQLAASTRRVGSVCTGAFVLAAAGLLDGC
jgi:transcriptional regulator GlxA family with amidase domain